MLDKEDIRLRRIRLLVRDLNRQLKFAADQGVPVSLEMEDITKSRDKTRRVQLILTEAFDKPGG